MTTCTLEDRVTPVIPPNLPPGFPVLETFTQMLTGLSVPIQDLKLGKAPVINVSGLTGRIIDVDVYTKFTHTWNADVTMTIQNTATGNAVTLTSFLGPALSNIFNGTLWDDQAPYPSNAAIGFPYINGVAATPLIPVEPLSAFIGEDPNGDWELEFYDYYPADTGVLTEWGITITTLAPEAFPVTPAKNFSTSDPAVPVPPLDSASQTVSVSGVGGYLWQVQVQTFLEHTKSFGTELFLTSPSGTVVALTKNFTPAGSLNFYNGIIWSDTADFGLDASYFPAGLNTNVLWTHSFTSNEQVPITPFQPLVTFLGEDPNGIWTLTAKDTAGGVGQIKSFNLIIISKDYIPPTGTTIVSGPSSPSSVSTPTFTFTAVDNTVPDDKLTYLVSIDGGKAKAVFSDEDPLTPGFQFTIPVPLSDGKHKISVQALDPDGNLDPTPAFYEWVIDTVKPTTTLTPLLGQLDPTGVQPIRFAVTFTKPVTGFTASDVVATFTGSGTPVVSVFGSGQNYVIEVTGLVSTGTLTVGLPADAAFDIAGNGNTAPNPATVSVVYDKTPPTVTVEQAPGQADPTKGDVRFVVTFSENVFGFTPDDIDFKGSTVPGKLTATISGSGANYIVTVSGMTGPGLVVVSIPANAVIDQSGNFNLASTSIDNSIFFDNAGPVPTIRPLTPVSSPLLTSRPLQFEIVFDKPVTGFDASDITFAGSTSLGKLQASVTGSGTTYLLTVVGMGTSGTVNVQVVAGSAVDAFGNLALASNLVSTPFQITSYYIAAPGPGNGPEIKVFNSDTGSLALNFFAYDPSFRGGVRVAQADFNGDGIPDIVTSVAQDGGPHIRVFSGTNGAELFSFFAYDPKFTGGVTIGAGDVNGDGVADIITGAGIGGGPHVRVFDGKTGAELYNFFAFEPTLRDGVTVSIGDVDGDGLGDLIVGAGPGGGPHIKVYSGRDLSLLDNFFPFAPTLRGGVFVSAGDLNFDGKAEVVIGSGVGATPAIAVRDGATKKLDSIFLSFGTGFTGGVRVAVQDFDYNGTMDLIAGAGIGGGPVIRAFDGLSRDPLGDLFAFNPELRSGLFVG